MTIFLSVPYPTEPPAPTGSRLSVVAAEDALLIAGEIDLDTRELVGIAARHLLAECGHGSCDLVLHMGGVSFVDAAGLGTLVSLNAGLAEHGARLRIVEPSRPVRRLVELCGLTAVLGLEPAAAHAVR